jgi:hypothetical protein
METETIITNKILGLSPMMFGIAAILLGAILAVPITWYFVSRAAAKKFNEMVAKLNKDILVYKTKADAGDKLSAEVMLLVDTVKVHGKESEPIIQELVDTNRVSEDALKCFNDLISPELMERISKLPAIDEHVST